MEFAKWFQQCSSLISTVLFLLPLLESLFFCKRIWVHIYTNAAHIDFILVSSFSRTCRYYLTFSHHVWSFFKSERICYSNKKMDELMISDWVEHSYHALSGLLRKTIRNPHNASKKNAQWPLIRWDWSDIGLFHHLTQSLTQWPWISMAYMINTY